MGKSITNWQFSIAMLVYQRVISSSDPIKPPFSYGFPMVCLWFSYGLPEVQYPHIRSQTVTSADATASTWTSSPPNCWDRPRRPRPPPRRACHPVGDGAAPVKPRVFWRRKWENGWFHHKCMTGWWFGTFCICPYIGDSHPNWRSYFFRGGESTKQNIWGFNLIQWDIQGLFGGVLSGRVTWFWSWQISIASSDMRLVTSYNYVYNIHMYIFVDLYIYIYVYIHTHTHQLLS